MKAIVIKDSNKEKINSIIKQIEGKATARTVNYDDLEQAVWEIEKELGISKKAMTGCKVKIDWNAQTFPKAYKYTPYGTVLWIEKTASGWNLKDVDRMPTRTHRYFLDLTEEAKTAIIESKLVFD